MGMFSKNCDSCDECSCRCTCKYYYSEFLIRQLSLRSEEQRNEIIEEAVKIYTEKANREIANKLKEDKINKSRESINLAVKIMKDAKDIIADEECMERNDLENKIEEFEISYKGGLNAI